MKKLIGIAATTALVFVGASAATAETTPVECVATDGWTQTIPRPAVGEPTITVGNPDYIEASTEQTFDHWQRYSWTGKWTSDEPPTFPGDGWQANTKSDPHGINAEGPYFRSNGNSGNGDWFYLQAVTKTTTIPAQGEPTRVVDNPDYVPASTETIEHAAVECDVPAEEVCEFLAEEAPGAAETRTEEDVVVPEIETHDVATPTAPVEIVAPVAPVAIETAA